MSLLFRPVPSQPRQIVLLVYSLGLTGIRIADLWGWQPASKWNHQSIKGKMITQVMNGDARSHSEDRNTRNQMMHGDLIQATSEKAVRYLFLACFFTRIQVTEAYSIPRNIKLLILQFVCTD